jgi:hypothetical protein
MRDTQLISNWTNFAAFAWRANKEREELVIEGSSAEIWVVELP